MRKSILLDMKNLCHIFAIFGAVILLPNCASIVSRASRDVQVQSVPSGLAFSITDASGAEVSKGTTPQTVSLSARGGYFKPAKYTVRVKRGGKVVGTHQVTAGINGWYFGNILIGGLIGMVIVDPLTGAMYRMPESITVETNSLASQQPRTLTVASIDSLTPAQRAQLVRL